MVACGGIENDTSTQTYKLFTSEQYGIEAEIPEDWAGVDGPENIMIREMGLVAFNSWGQTDFWVREIIEHNPDGSVKSSHYGPQDVASQVPAGEAYVVLIEINGPPPAHDYIPVEYELNDLSGLVNIHDWRQDGGNQAVFSQFYKSGMSLSLQIYCSPTATDKTLEGLNHLLRSWRF